MKAAARALVLVLGGAACGGRAKPAHRPAPASAPQNDVARPTPRNTAATLPDSIPEVVITIPDPVLARRAVAVFGASSGSQPVDSAATEGPTWDNDDRPYETHG